MAEAHSTRAWPSVPGTVLASYVRVNRGRGINYTPMVQYAYSVQGKQYTGFRISSVEYGEPESDAEAVITKYPVGKPTLVHYDPANPLTSVLQPGATWFVYLWVAIAWTVTFIGSVVLYFSWFRKRRSDA